MVGWRISIENDDRYTSIRFALSARTPKHASCFAFPVNKRQNGDDKDITSTDFLNKEELTALSHSLGAPHLHPIRQAVLHPSGTFIHGHRSGNGSRLHYFLAR
jgi:hypothetical protein